MKHYFIISLLHFFLISGLISAQIRGIDYSIIPEEREKHLQRALELRKVENYISAIKELELILSANPDDASVLLLKGDIHLQAGEFDNAVKTYERLLPLEFEPTAARINLSYALFMNNSTSQALEIAESAWQNDKTNSSAIVNYFNAMLWNVKTEDASIFLTANEGSLKEDQLLVMKARLYTTSGDYQNGLKYYETLFQKYNNKHYAREYAEVLLGKNEINHAADIISDSKELYSTSEYNVLQEKIENSRLQNAGTETVYFEDIAKNTRTETSFWWQQRDGLTYRLGFKGGLSSSNSLSDEKTDSKFAGVYIFERWSLAWSGQTDLAVQQVKQNEQKTFTSFSVKQTLKYQPNDRQMFGVVFSTDILNFTSSLLGKNIRLTNFGYLYHTMFDGSNGFYSQGGIGVFSDKNLKYDFFGSYYHLFGTKPLFKAGINFSALHFKTSKPAVYFSPDKYFSTEIFADYNTNLFGIPDLFLKSQAAVGLQNIKGGRWDTAFRLQAEISYNIYSLEPSIKYQTSNIASNTGTGYKFNWFTFGLKWRW